MMTLTFLVVVTAAITLIGHIAKGWPLFLPVGLLLLLHVLDVLPR